MPHRYPLRRHLVLRGRADGSRTSPTSLRSGPRLAAPLWSRFPKRAVTNAKTAVMNAETGGHDELKRVVTMERNRRSRWSETRTVMTLAKGSSAPAVFAAATQNGPLLTLDAASVYYTSSSILYRADK